MKLVRFGSPMEERPGVWLDDTPAITPMQLRTKCRRPHMGQDYAEDVACPDDNGGLAVTLPVLPG